MATTYKYGTWKMVDDNGNITVLYPATQTDSSLMVSNKAADAATVGDKLTWKRLYANVTGSSTTVPLSDIEFAELSIKVNVKNLDVIIPMHIPRIMLVSTAQQYRGGYWINNTDESGGLGGNGCQVNFEISTTSLKLKDVRLNGADVTSETIYSVYYR